MILSNNVNIEISSGDHYMLIRCAIPSRYRVKFFLSLPRWLFAISHGPFYSELISSPVYVLNIPISKLNEFLPYGKSSFEFLFEMLSVAQYQAVLDANEVY